MIDGGAVPFPGGRGSAADQPSPGSMTGPVAGVVPCRSSRHGQL